MDRKTICTLVLIAAVLLILGCSSGNESRDVRSQPVQKSVEATLVQETSGGRLVDVYDEYVRLKAGETGENWIIINNVKDAGDTFTIQPCSGCEFDETYIDISMGKYSIVKFRVSAESGEKEIRIKDSHNNAYGFAKFNVIVE